MFSSLTAPATNDHAYATQTAASDLASRRRGNELCAPGRSHRLFFDRGTTVIAEPRVSGDRCHSLLPNADGQLLLPKETAR